MSQATRNDTAVLDAIRDVIDHTTAGTVFGTPISRDSVTVLPVARVSGGGGGGSGGGGGAADEERPEAEGVGGGLGLSAKPLGLFVINDSGKVSWRPAVDVNKVILGGQVVAAIALLTIRSIVKARCRASTGR